MWKTRHKVSVGYCVMYIGANSSVSGRKPAKSWLDEAVEQATQSIAVNSAPVRPTPIPVPGSCGICQTDHCARRVIQHQANWLRAGAPPSRNRFSSAIGTRYSGNQSTFSYYGRAARRGPRPPVGIAPPPPPGVANSSSFSTMSFKVDLLVLQLFKQASRFFRSAFLQKHVFVALIIGGRA